MSVKSRTIIETIYTITCDYCYRQEILSVEKSYGRGIYNFRTAVRSIGWTLQRNDIVMCNICRCYKKS